MIGYRFLVTILEKLFFFVFQSTIFQQMLFLVSLINDISNY